MLDIDDLRLGPNNQIVAGGPLEGGAAAERDDELVEVPATPIRAQ